MFGRRAVAGSGDAGRPGSAPPATDSAADKPTSVPDSSSSRARLSRRQAGQTSSVEFPAIIAPHAPQTVVAVFIQDLSAKSGKKRQNLLQRAWFPKAASSRRTP